MKNYLDPIQVEYYIFNGWYTDSEFKYECDPAQKIFEDTTIYASCDADLINTPLTFTCTNLGDDGEASIDLYAMNNTSSSFTRYLKYRINDGDWKPIADADQDGKFTINPTEGMHINILQSDEKLLKEGDTIRIRGNNSNFSQTTQGQLLLIFRTGFDEADTFDVSGNIMSLASEEAFGENKTIPNDHFFDSTFAHSEPYEDEGYCNIINADKLLLPAETLKSNCYSYLFYYNKKLVNAPKLLPATDLPLFAYESMFEGCSSLVTAPELSAINFTGSSPCTKMFNGCIKLEELKVAFGKSGSSEWPTDPYCTFDWLGGGAGTSVQKPVFYWKGVDDPDRTLIPTDEDHVPANWSVQSY